MRANGVLHCFSGSRPQIDTISHGGYFGYGATTFCVWVALVVLLVT
jgi:Tat protein secretion system quality control protein TatD with DNase activity